MKPLAGRTILITRSQEQAPELAALLTQMGARVVETPVIGFEEPADWGPADAAIARLDAYDLIILTSANAAARFHSRMTTRHAKTPVSSRLVAIGPATARRMESLGMPPEVVASDSRAEGLLALLSNDDLVGRRLLIPRAETARDLLPDELRKAGALVDVVTVYRTIALPIPEAARRLLVDRQVDAVTFTSPSTVTNLIAAVGGIETLEGTLIAVIGPVTAQAARDAGLTVGVESPKTDISILAAAIAGYFEKRI